MSFLHNFTNCSVPVWFIEAVRNGDDKEQLKAQIKQKFSDELSVEDSQSSLWQGDTFDAIAEAVMQTYLKQLKMK